MSNAWIIRDSEGRFASVCRRTGIKGFHVRSAMALPFRSLERARSFCADGERPTPYHLSPKHKGAFA